MRIPCAPQAHSSPTNDLQPHHSAQRSHQPPVQFPATPFPHCFPPLLLHSLQQSHCQKNLNSRSALGQSTEFPFCPPPAPMAPLSSSPAAARKVFPPRRRPSPPSPHRKFRSMEDIMRTAKYAVTERDDYSRVVCSKCGSGEDSDEILLCDRCDDGYHMLCLRPIVVRVPIGSWYCPSCSRNRPVKRMDSHPFT